jgi:hypothetical protein
MFLLLEQNGSDELQLLDEKAEVAIQELFTPHIIYETPGFPVSTKETYATIIYDC